MFHDSAVNDTNSAVCVVCCNPDDEDGNGMYSSKFYSVQSGTMMSTDSLYKAVTHVLVVFVIRNQQNRKATGHDVITNRAIEQLSDVSVFVLEKTILFSL